MFRPNRVGTPVISATNNSFDTAAFALAVNGVGTAQRQGNCINVAPAGEFSRDAVVWSAAARSIPAGNVCSILQQFTVTQPIDGDTIGIECIGTIVVAPSAGLIIRPIFGKLNAAVAGAWAVATFQGQPCGLDANTDIVAPVTAAALSYKTQVIQRQTAVSPAGTYAHGWELINLTGGAITFNYLDVSLGERQLNYQETVGYRDTLR